MLQHHKLPNQFPEPCQRKTLYIYINKDANPSTISTRHVEANVNTKENQNDQNCSNEVADLMLKGLQIIKPPFWQFLQSSLDNLFYFHFIKRANYKTETEPQNNPAEYPTST
jgi:hypothetical protein